MPKPNRKKSAKNADEICKANEGLELVSIGNLYNGPWDKKYWSSSRGKDRYPFPVGYRAVRAHNGITYRMEISEGSAGPLFTITSADGQACSGQTPDIAWESGQRKSSPRLKIWHGKRFTPKIDGVEFFGFKNPFVQRLLRELVANINGSNERCSSPSSSCGGLIVEKSDRECPEKSGHPDLLAYLAGPSTRGKRSRRSESKKPISVREVSVKKHRPQDLAEEGSPTNFVSLSDHLKERAGSAQRVSNHAGSTNSNSSRVSNLCAEENLLDRSPDTTETGINFHVETENQSRKDLAGVNDVYLCAPDTLDVTQSKDSAGVNDVNLCAPDTLDVTQSKDSAGVNDVNLCAPDTLDGTQYYPDSDPRVLDDKTHKGSVCAVDKAIPEGFLAETHLQEDQNTHSSNPSSQKSDFDSIGQDMARSMMTLLLPQAVPLLKKAPRKERNTTSSETNFEMEVQKKKSESDNFLDVQTQADGPTTNVAVQIKDVTHIKGGYTVSVIPSSDCSKYLVPDSFEDNQCDDRPTLPSIPCAHIAEAYRSTSDEDTFPSKTLNGLARSQESSNFYTKNSTNKGNVNPGELESSVDKSKKEDNAKSAVAKTGRATTQVQRVVYSRRKSRKASNLNGPTPDKIIMRNKGDDSVLERSPPLRTVIFPAVDNKQSETDLSFPEGRLEEQCFDLQKEVTAITSGHTSIIEASVVADDQACKCVSEAEGQQNGHDLSLPLIKSAQGCCISSNVEAENSFNTYISSRNMVNIENKPSNAAEDQVGADMEPQQDMELRNELEEQFQLLGCYIHPMPVISISLNSKGKEIYVSVLCGTVKDNIRTLFIYKVATDETTGKPAFVGYTALILPTLRDNEGRKVAVERSGWQFTPDGQSFVLLDRIKVPHCREQNINCLCSTCMSSSFGENAVKVVKVNFGYVSVVLRLKANDFLHSILVCGPDHLVAVGESGRLHIWAMNFTWSAQTEEFILPAYDCNSPGIVEVMKIPKSVVLVLGYNGFGEFSVWNISSRICLSKFSAAKTSICQFFPVGLFSWKSIHPPSGCDVKEHIDGVLPSIIQQRDNYDCHPFEEKDIAIWILVSTPPNSDAQNKHIPSSSNSNPVGLWRLALLVKNTMIMGSALDPRAASVGISSGHGVIGTCDGLAYIWEMSTGARLGSLHHFKGSSVSSIAADEFGSDFLAVASNGGHLLVYKHS